MVKPTPVSENNETLIEKESDIFKEVCELKGLSKVEVNKNVLDFIKILNIHKNEIKKEIKSLNESLNKKESAMESYEKNVQEFIISYINECIEGLSNTTFMKAVDSKLDKNAAISLNTYKTLESKCDKLIHGLQKEIKEIFIEKETKEIITKKIESKIESIESKIEKIESKFKFYKKDFMIDYVTFIVTIFNYFLIFYLYKTK